MNDVTRTSFVPELDARQRAMLAEMGVRVWAPKPPVAAPSTAPAPVAVKAPPAAYNNRRPAAASTGRMRPHRNCGSRPT